MALWKKILIGIALFIGSMIAIPFFLTSGLNAPVERHVEALRDGNLDAAYAETSIAFQQSTSLEQFAAFIERYPALKNITDYSFPSREIKDNVGAVKGTLTTADGGTVPIEFKLVKENDQWKILGLSLGGS